MGRHDRERENEIKKEGNVGKQMQKQSRGRGLRSSRATKSTLKALFPDESSQQASTLSKSGPLCNPGDTLRDGGLMPPTVSNLFMNLGRE